MASRKCASRYKRVVIPKPAVISPAREATDLSETGKALKAATLASKKAAATDKRVSSIEKSLSELKDLMLLQFKGSQGDEEAGATEAGTSARLQHDDLPSRATRASTAAAAAPRKKKKVVTHLPTALEDLDTAESTRQAVLDSLLSIPGQDADLLPTELPDDLYDEEQEDALHLHGAGRCV
jgi:hypothetical protein